MKMLHLHVFRVDVIVVRYLLLCKASYYHKNSICLFPLSLNHYVPNHVAASIYYTQLPSQHRDAEW